MNETGTMPNAARESGQLPAAAAQPPSTALEFAAKAKNLDSLRNAVVDAAGVGAGLWFSYLFVLFYLLIAVGGVTHRDLFLENPVRLPFLNVDLPLVGFFVLGPALFLVLHAYVLMHFVLLAGKVGIFHAELQEQIGDEEVRARLRQQLPSNIFVQILAGPREVRGGIFGFMLRLVAQISLVAGPVALLGFFQLQFLPYHHEAITWWQRIAILGDLALLWTLWPSVAQGKIASIRWHDLRHGKVIAAALASLVPILLVFSIATFPGEWLDASLPSVRFVPTKWLASKVRESGPAESHENRTSSKVESRENNSTSGPTEKIANVRSLNAFLKGLQLRTSNLVASFGWSSLHELLVGGNLDLVTQKPTSLWSNRLVLLGIDSIDRAKFDTQAKLAATPETLSLRGRRLEGAILIGAQLRKVDFTGAHLQGADLSSTDLREARFDCRAVNLRIEVKPFGMSEDFETRCTDLRGVSLEFADLTGASFFGADLRGALLDDAKLRGVSLFSARLQGALMDQAQLQGAELDSADLQGAWLKGAAFQGASLNRTNLQGAMLRDAQLQGVSLEDTRLRGATLDHIFVWRSDISKAELEGTSIVVPEIERKYYHRPECPRAEDPCDWSANSFGELKRLIEQQILTDYTREQALKRITILDPEKSLDGEEGRARAWVEFAQSSPSRESQEKNLTERLREIGCDAGGAPFVARGLLWSLNGRFEEEDSPHRAELAAAFLDPTHCPGARGLSEEERSKLRELRSPALGKAKD